MRRTRLPHLQPRRYGRDDVITGAQVRAIVFLTALALAACSGAPRMGDHVSEAARTAPYPELVALGPLLAGLPPPDQHVGTGALAARAATLRARASRLRGTVVDPHSRDRMRAAVARHTR